MKKYIKIIFVLSLFLLIPTDKDFKAMTENALEKEISDKSSELNNLYDEIEKINEEIDENKSNSKEITQNKKTIEEDLGYARDNVSNILMFLQYYSIDDMWLMVLGSDDFVENMYFVSQFFKGISKELDELLEKDKKLKSAEEKYQKNIKELDTKKSSLEKEVKEFEDIYNELQIQLQELKKENSFDLKTDSNAAISQEKQNSYMAQAGISSSNYDYVDYIVSYESSWNYTATNPYTGAYGLCQALPGSKMSAFGSDWQTNPVTQLKFCNSYANSRYGSWSGAVTFIRNNGWW